MNLALHTARKQVTFMLVLSIVKNVIVVIASLLELLQTAVWHVSVLRSRGIFHLTLHFRAEDRILVWPLHFVFRINNLMPGTGNATEACGGSSRLNLFWSGTSGPQSNPGVGLWKFSGCYA